jgi:hypothetical protein
MRKTLESWAFWLEPPIGIEPMTYALREAREHAPATLPAQTSALTAQIARFAHGATRISFQISFHPQTSAATGSDILS